MTSSGTSASGAQLPEIPKLAGGGIVPGKDTGSDNQLVAMRSGEGVLTPERGPGDRPRHRPRAEQEVRRGHLIRIVVRIELGQQQRRDVGKEVRRIGERVVRRGAEHMLGFSGGGILGGIGNFFTSLGHDIMTGADFVADFAKNPIGSVEGLLDKAVSTSAGGDLGKIMTAIPKTLITDLADLVGASGAAAAGRAAARRVVGCARVAAVELEDHRVVPRR